MFGAVSRWVNSLAGRMILVLLATTVITQILTIAYFTGRSMEADHIRRGREFFGEVAAFVELFQTRPQIDRARYLEGFENLGSFYWIAPRPGVLANGALTQENLPDIAGRLKFMPGINVLARDMPDTRPLIQKFLPSPQPPESLPGPEGLAPGMLPAPDDVIARGALANEAYSGQRPPPPNWRQGGPPPRRGPGPGGRGGNRPPPPPPGVDVDTWFAERGFPPPPPGPIERDENGLPIGPMPNDVLRNDFLWNLFAEGGIEDIPPDWQVAVELPDGQWLNATLLHTPGAPPLAMSLYAQAAMSGLATTLVIIVVVTIATRRLSALAVAADKLGRGEDTDPLPEAGPWEIRQLVYAFNTMNVRLRRFIESRTRMLGAISHDLRTPITSMRIRAELIDDDENRERMLVTLEEMKHLAESTLALAKEDSISEATKTVDLTALIESIEDDLRDVGHDVSSTAQEDVVLSCRPHSLKRAIRNLAENGVKYGKRVRLAMAANDRTVTITVDDDGPGIPEEQQDRMFMPFVRMEESRNKETGGVGLGLAICRSIIHSHGGELAMNNRPEGGLQATVRIPRNGDKLD